VDDMPARNTPEFLRHPDAVDELVAFVADTLAGLDAPTSRTERGHRLRIRGYVAQLAGDSPANIADIPEVARPRPSASEPLHIRPATAASDG
jgi:hypothetical protein